MKTHEYIKRAERLLHDGKINDEAYEAMVMNADVFCDEDDEYTDPRFPRGYAEIEYDDFEDPEAILGARWDDMNFLRYYER